MSRLIDDDLEEILRRKKIADYYYDNYRKYYEEKKYSKASEFLWGTINNLVYAIGLFHGKKIGKHNEVVEFTKELALIENRESIIEQLASAERIHANFFHDFMNELMFEDDKEKVEKLIETLSEILGPKIQDMLDSQ